MPTERTPEELAKLAQEAKDWDSGKLKPTDQGWVDAPEALIPRGTKVSVAPTTPRGIMTVRRLLDTDPCPCKSGKPFGECEKRAPVEGLTPENTLHLLFEERDPTPPEPGQEPLTFYAIQTAKMDGRVPAEDIVASISKRLHGPAVQRALDKLEWHAVNARGLKMTMMPPGTEVIEVPGRVGPFDPEAAKKIELLDGSGNPIK